MIAALFFRHWITIAIGAALALTAFGAGWKLRDWRCDAAVLKIERANAKASARMQDQADTAASDYETDRGQTYADSNIRQERIRTIYRDRPMRSDCAVPDDARRLLVEAVESANTGATGESRR